ncbi:MAG: (d)CMP kinase [Candidatus Eremiobacter antarcticus]|nr:(d)CMP kinase [Candidatus Eremiobacteraeota bacterium]MBC5808669.1 (d)CMP kinase [Candidatus Eremiobacteraeota bacterium]
MHEPSTPLQVAIDGPVASGKSTVALQLANRLGFQFLDTGALYRAVAYTVLQRGVAADDADGVAHLVAEHMPAVTMDASTGLRYHIAMDGRLLHDELFSREVSQAVSSIAAMPHVRERLIDVQREFARDKRVVMAGRDIGTVVLPQAAFKFYLTAGLDVRVDRRQRQLQRRGIELTQKALQAEIRARDARDQTRVVSPLVKASDATEVDTSALSIDEVVSLLERTVRASTG